MTERLTPEERLVHAEKGLRDGKITRAEFDLYLKHELGIEPHIHRRRTHKENVIAIVVVLALVVGVWALFQGDQVGMVTLPIVNGTNAAIDTHPFANTTTAKLSLVQPAVQARPIG